MKKYALMKDTTLDWVGDIPEHWDTKPFYSLFDEEKRSNKGMQSENLLSLSYGMIKRKRIDSLDGLLPASFETYQIVEPGELVFRLTDLQNDKRSLRSALVRERGIITSAYLAVKSSKINSKYASYLFRSYDLSKVFYSMGGGLRQGLNFSDLRRLPILYPTHYEQQKIAQFLDYETAKIDALIGEQKRLIELLKEKRQAVISDAVTKGLNPDAPMKDSGVEWLGEVPRHWKITKLKFFVTTRKGIAFKADDFVDEGIPVVKASDIKKSTVRTPSTYLNEIPQGASKAILNAGDIVISTVGSLPSVKNSAVGQICRTPSSLDGALLNQNTVIIDVTRESSLSKNFLFIVMSSQGFREHLDYYAHGTANQASLSVGDILEFEMPLPPKIDQKDIYRLVDNQLRAFGDLVQQSSLQAHLLKERRSALISAAVTGKIDVRDWQPPQGSDTVDKKESAQTEMQHG